MKKDNMKHTNLGDEIFTIKKPDTSWHSTLVGVVTMIGISFIIYLVAIVISDVVPLVK